MQHQSRVGHPKVSYARVYVFVRAQTKLYHLSLGHKRDRMFRMAQLPEDLLELDQQVCFALAVASRSVIGIYRPILEPLGLTHPQYLVMLLLWGESPLRFRDIAEKLRLDPATLSPLVKRLEHSGLIERHTIVGDDRTFSLAPTQAGRELRKQALSVPRAVIDRLGLPIERLVALRDELHAVIAAVESPDRGGKAD